jgi:hypothetical protein
MSKSPDTDVGTAKPPIKRPSRARKRKLPPEALRALAEAEARRATQQRTQLPEEQGGRNGPEPTRFGDWEVKGIASDF